MDGLGVLDRQVARLTKAIRLLWEQGDEGVLPALILVFATIDGLAWLQRRNRTGESDGADFQKWVEQYFPPGWNPSVTPGMLWAARCGLLHAQAAESRLSRDGVVPEIWYRWNDLGILPMGTNPTTLPIFVHPELLILALNDGIERFRRAIDSDSQLREQVEEQVAKLWTPVLYPPETKSRA